MTPDLIFHLIPEPLNSDADDSKNPATAGMDTGTNAGNESLRPQMPQQLSEADRAAMFTQEMLHIYQQRVPFLANLGLVLLPIFAVMHAILSPQSRLPVATTHLCLLTVCASARLASRHFHTMGQARFVSLFAYLFISLGTAIIGIQLSGNDSSIAFHNQFLVYSSYHEVILSVLLLPYSVWECLAVAIIVLGCSFWSVIWSAPLGLESFYYSHVMVIAVTAFVVCCIAHFQDKLRRDAFNSAFDLSRSAAQLQVISTLDAVTGGFNRHYLEKMLEIEINRATRFSRPLSLMMFDLDHFKAVNDTHGHATGDEVLRQVWQCAASTVREIDTVARYGGDEFIVVLPEANEDDARQIAQRLKDITTQHLQKFFGASQLSGQVTLSIGLITLPPGQTMSYHTLIDQADGKLYEAKRLGKNRIC